MKYYDVIVDLLMRILENVNEKGDICVREREKKRECIKEIDNNGGGV
jgi:hypothetical protein